MNAIIIIHKVRLSKHQIKTKDQCSPRRCSNATYHKSLGASFGLSEKQNIPLSHMLN